MLRYWLLSATNNFSHWCEWAEQRHSFCHNSIPHLHYWARWWLIECGCGYSVDFHGRYVWWKTSGLNDLSIEFVWQFHMKSRHGPFWWQELSQGVLSSVRRVWVMFPQIFYIEILVAGTEVQSTVHSPHTSIVIHVVCIPHTDNWMKGKILPSVTCLVQIK